MKKWPQSTDTLKMQRYISNELCHFVGRGKTSEEQYELLVEKILRPGWITYPPHDLRRPRSLSLDLSQSISADRALKYEVICFCDIPEPDLRIHVEKYSKFGLSFQKSFLIDRGASPVFYVANESPVPVNSIFNPQDFAEEIKVAVSQGRLDRSLYFGTSLRALIDVLVALDTLVSIDAKRYFRGADASEFQKRLGVLVGLSDDHIRAAEQALRGNEQSAAAIKMFTDFLLNYVFSFVKCFDAKRSFDDQGNYYMEREWRIAGNLNFSLTDVCRVFFPSSYASRFRTDLPAYVGQISFIE